MPSFIVTLASFFALRGVMLVISKRLVGKVQVDQITEQKGAKFFKNWIAHEWKFTEFGGRDTLFVGLVIAGGAAFIYGLLEQSFIRRDVASTGAASVVTAVGVIAAVVGFIGLLQTDGVGNNVIFGVIAGVGSGARHRRARHSPAGRPEHDSGAAERSSCAKSERSTRPRHRSASSWRASRRSRSIATSVRQC